MWFCCYPAVCEKCAALSRRPGAHSAGPSGFDHVAGRSPHDELEKLADAGQIERGIWLFHCHRCDSWWEYDAWTYFPERSRLRRIRPVASLENWTAKQQRALKGPSLFFGGSLLFGGGLVVIAVFAGIGWLVNRLFSFEAANWVVYCLVLACLWFAFWMTRPSAERHRTDG